MLLIAESTNALYQFLDEMAAFGLDQGEEVLWFELDRPLSMVTRSLDGTIDSDPGNLTILDAYEPRVNQASPNGDTRYATEQAGPENIPDVVTQALSKVEPGSYRLVLTSLSSLLQTLSPEEVLGFVRHLVAMGEELGGLQIFTMIKDAHPPEMVAMFKHVCTAVFELGMERKGFGLYSYLKVEKLLGVPDAAKLMLFNETEDGLRLESTRRVF